MGELIASIEVDDGIAFRTDAASSRSIRETAQYAGVRVAMPAQIGQARQSLSLDINFGDPVTPGATRMPYPQLLEATSFTLLGYPIQTVLAEKLATMVALGDLNTRDRDWGDVWRLTGTQDLKGSDVREAVTATAAHRGVPLRPLSQAVSRLSELRQGAYSVWRRKQAADADYYPDDFADVVRDVIGFADPILHGHVEEQDWHAGSRRWRPVG